MIFKKDFATSLQNLDTLFNKVCQTPTNKEWGEKLLNSPKKEKKQTYNALIFYARSTFQVSFCKRNPTFMESVRLGAARAIDECQFQFRSRRWNCSTLGMYFLRFFNYLSNGYI